MAIVPGTSDCGVPEGGSMSLFNICASRRTHFVLLSCFSYVPSRQVLPTCQGGVLAAGSSRAVAVGMRVCAYV